ncbi:hypothetical protein [Paracidovorax anthurii]|uniref:Uncharacterized protein n=1 Tax=Paracidovorax anthurii TaxID=78229 RepID=A0A328ZIT5_9BURK|nr:hypothetical protein [Paracidovorax anthurii]RAR85255.1 hypothetical protein AX018_100633 [Paracidovorax anthurii]WCM91939.1 hypothetical protein M5C99_16370 [Acidovorax sp. NCPPB 2350]
MSKAIDSFTEGLLQADAHIPADFHFVAPDAVRGAAHGYSSVIAGIVAQCYGPDYPAPTQDSAYLVTALESGSQTSCVWSMNEASLRAEQFGTLSLYDADFPFGSGIGELGKSGSASDGSAKYGFALFLRQWLETAGSRYRSFFCTSRNCSSRAAREGRVRGGGAVRYLVSHVMKMTQWGYAPWYLMPDSGAGSYELLDFFVRLPGPLHDAPGVGGLRDIHVFGESTEAFIRQVFIDNWGAAPRLVRPAGGCAPVPAGWLLLEEDYQQEKNPAKLVASPGGGDFHRSLHRLEQVACSTLTVILPMTEAYVGAQRTLEDSGYTFCALYPPLDAQGTAQGMWCRLNTERPLILPKYHGKPDGAGSPWLARHAGTLAAELLDRSTAAVRV